MTDQTPLTRPFDETVKEQLKDHEFAVAMYEEFGETVKELEQLRAENEHLKAERDKYRAHNARLRRSECARDDIIVRLQNALKSVRDISNEALGES